MKVAKLEIENFRHLENLSFDFTYQSGPKKGQPLDKICFIGQSATGKTSLLELVKKTIEKDKSGNGKYLIDIFDGVSKTGIKFSHLDLSKFTEFHSSRFRNTIAKRLLYFSSDQLSPDNFENISKKTDETDIVVTIVNSLVKESDIQKFAKFQNLLKQPVFEFNFNTNKIIWEYILDEVSVYRNKSNQKGSDLINFKAKDITSIIKEIEKWRKQNPNPLEILSEKCLNPILKKLNLEVDLIDVSCTIPLKPINSEKAIPANALSTGTKQLMLNALPLYKLPTDDSIIIIDEPERSLFPDIQMELIPFYQSLAPKAQFIVATHSPFITASFEPEERFILYFDDKGKVQYRNGVSPIGDDPNDILKNDFCVNLMNDIGENAYKKYLDLKQKMAAETNLDKKKELLKEVVTLGDKYQF